MRKVYKKITRYIAFILCVVLVLQGFVVPGNGSWNMTAEAAELPWELIGRVTSRIVNEVKGVNRVLYDCTVAFVAILVCAEITCFNNNTKTF